MAKRPTLTDLTGQYAAQSLINNNHTEIETAFDNTISRDGSIPNQMEADFDLNGNDLLNANNITATSITIDGNNLTASVNAAALSASQAEDSATQAALSAGQASISADSAASSLESVEAIQDLLPDWQGSWTTSTSYEVGDLVGESGSSYICLEDHTSGTFSTDLSASKWELFASAGTAGAGTGDMLAANNLSDVADAGASLANLGGTTVGRAVFTGNASAGRTALEVVKQTTATDTTAGSVLLNGAHGWGAQVPDITDLDALNYTTAFRGMPDAPGMPIAGTAGYGICLSRASNFAVQIVYVGGYTYQRVKAITWGAWERSVETSGAVTGDTLYYNGARWARLPKGTSGQLLAMDGGGSMPTWTDPGTYSPPTAYGAVGTYVFGFTYGTTKITAGMSVAGSTIEPAGVQSDGASTGDDLKWSTDLTKGGAALSGTWRAMGQVNQNTGVNAGRATLFLRIS